MQEAADPPWAIRVAEDERFAIDLAGNPTTGYTWEAEIDPDHLELIEREFEPAAEGVGGGGREIFRFRARQAGATEIAFVYRRPWGGAPQDERRFWVVIS
jgi:inhibitor of cysteine peptidase